MIGIGNELRGDDLAGPTVVRGLQALTPLSPTVLLLDAGMAPENFSGPIRRFAPDLVLLIDAAEMGEAPGTVCYVTWQETTGFSASTHTLPLYFLAQYLETELGCQVVVLGVQPENLDFGAPFSPIVQQAVNEVISELTAILQTPT